MIQVLAKLPVPSHFQSGLKVCWVAFHYAPMQVLFDKLVYLVWHVLAASFLQSVLHMFDAGLSLICRRWLFRTWLS